MTVRFKPAKNRTVEERFWEKVDKKGENECWEWLGATNRGGRCGYGQLNIRGNRIQAHRLSWKIHNGDVIEGMWVLHKCDNMKCVNPNHLFLGNNSDNIKDSVIKGRFHGNNGKCRGENQWFHKLTENDVAEIRRLYSTNRYSCQDIAVMYGVTRGCIFRVVKKENWRHA